MNTKNYLTVAGIVGIIYGLFFFLLPEQCQEFYGVADQANEYGTRMQRFFGGAILSMGFLGVMSRNAQASIGRKAILGAMAVFFIFNLILIVMWILNGAPSFSKVDAVITLILGAGAVYFYTKE